MPLINCEVNFDLNWSKNCVIVASNADQEKLFSMTDTKFYVPAVPLSTQNNARSGFKRTINWKKYQSKNQ